MLVKHKSIDIELIQSFADTLEPFKTVTIMMSSQTTVTISLVKPLLSKLMTLSRPTVGEIRVLHQTKAILHHDLENR